MGKHRKSSHPDNRICNRCSIEFPATKEFFVGDKSRLLGITYDCRKCHSIRKVGTDKRLSKERWASMTIEQRERRTFLARRYAKTIKGRACFLRGAYKKIDSCDFSTDELVEVIQLPCTYCGTLERNRGLDRIDNNLPHIKGNVVPACEACNFARGDRFSMEEMILIGNVIRKIFMDRISDPTRNAQGL